MRLKIISFILLITQVGCATIFQGRPDEVPIASNPSGADVYLNNKHVGTTPMKMMIRHSDDADIQVSKNGYRGVSMSLHKVIAGTTLLNLLLVHGIILGFGIDLIAHNQGKYPEDQISLDLQEESAHASR